MINCITKDNRSFIIRQPAEEDAEKVLRYSKMIFASTDQLLTTPQDFNMTVEDERAWIRMLTTTPNANILIAELDNQIAGLLFFVPNTRLKNAHTGEFGITVHPGYQQSGIGRQLIENVLLWAKENAAIEKVYLQVFATNGPAIKLYKSLGFTEEGRHINAIKQLSGEYVDILQMYIETH